MKNDILSDGLRLRRTSAVLRCIASHAYSRRSRDTLSVGIMEFDDICTITVIPDTVVYPDIHRRKRVDLQRIQDHVILDHFADLIHSVNELGQVTIKAGTLLPGIYHYEFSTTLRKRRWTRFKESL